MKDETARATRSDSQKELVKFFKDMVAYSVNLKVKEHLTRDLV